MIPAAPLLTAGERLDARRLIQAQGLAFEDGCDDLVGIYASRSPDQPAPRLVATAARAGCVLKMFAVDDAWQGGEALATLTEALVSLGRSAGHDAFLVFTRPEHASSFEYCHFRLLVATGGVALLECGGGLERYLDAHRHLRREGRNGAVVINGNPFTRGHQFLVEQAAARVETLYVFIVREDRSVFPFDVRYKLAAESVRHVPNAVLLDTSRYAVSAATFPSYFLRRNDDKARLQMEVDVRLFGAHLAPPFGIAARFVGTEPFCETTAAYNRTMADVLPGYGVELVEIARATDGARAISATTVREALAAGDWSTVEKLVPPATRAFLRSAEGGRLLAGSGTRDSGAL
jgi:[citrate (pro-3S)-lyase] ligase